ncbi:MAG: putative multicopper oxidase [Gammaproteobacteria bacterium]|nr:putative multicopper oxidase [Gammaproteobacteria bacterium]
MDSLITRRHLLTTAVTTAGIAALARVLPARAQPATAIRLTAERRTIEVNRKAVSVFALRQPGGTQGVILDPGQRFTLDLTNLSGQPTIIHWHGQLPPWKEDGFPWRQTPPFAPGAARYYDFQPITGTYWMHSHRGLQEQSLMTAPLIIRNASEIREDRQEIVMMLHDFSFRTPNELLAGLTGATPDAADRMATQMENISSPSDPSIAANSPGSTQGNMTMPMGGMDMSHMNMPGMRRGSSMRMSLNDVDYDAYLANDRTLADPEVVRVAAGGRLRLRIINGASSSQFWIDLGKLTGQVVAADGHPVNPVAGRRFPLAMAQRLDILVDVPSEGTFAILAQVEGKRARTGIIIATTDAHISRINNAVAAAPAVDNSLEARLAAVNPLAPRKPDLVYRITLSGNMRPYAWALNGQYWPNITPLMLRKGQRVEIELVNHSTMAHPMHLHGHAFQVVALNGTSIVGAVRDTVLVPPMTSVRLAFDADNPGRWAFHCHNLYHMVTGMMTEFRYDGIAL